MAALKTDVILLLDLLYSLYYNYFSNFHAYSTDLIIVGRHACKKTIQKQKS